MDISVFKKISGYGRISYSICCLEKALLHYKYPIKKWNWILEKLWQHSTAPFFDEWCYEVADYLPDILLEDSTYSDKDYEYISENQFNILYETYSDLNPIVIQIFRLIYELATADLYSKIRNSGKYTTLTYLKEIINIMKKNGIELPDYTVFLKYKYDINVNDGLGERIGREYSLILN